MIFSFPYWLYLHWFTFSVDFQMTLDNDIASNLPLLVDHLAHLHIQEASVCSTSANLSVSSAAETQVEGNEATDSLNAISSHFSVKPTKYGGRSCFANSDLSQDTIVHECSLPLSSTIARPFKKEVCEFCLTFSHGKTLKFKLMLPDTSASSLALYFCSQACMNKFIALDVDSLYLESLLRVESLFIKGLTQRQYDLERMQEEEDAETEAVLKLENELKQATDMELFISQKWQEAETVCQLALSKLKPKQRQNFNNLRNLIPKISEQEYLEMKYIIGVLFQMYKQDNCSNNELASSMSSSTLELQIFPLLQSNDIEKCSKYPCLLHSYIRIYKFLRISTLDKLQRYVTPSGIRSIIAKMLTNAFGIWSTDIPNVERELLGYSLYASASFFNHSCRPNVIHTRVGARIIFKLLKNVRKNEELLISYIPYNNDGRETRQNDLKEWFFDCSCERCVEEKKLKM